MRQTKQTRYMLDANSFDYILEHGLAPRAVRQLGDILITTIQHAELLSVPEPHRRRRLLQVLAEINPLVKPAAIDSRLREPAPPDGPATGRARVGGKPAGWQDAAIGAAAAAHDCILVTDDRQFRALASAQGVTTLSCAEAFADLPPGSSA